MAGKYLQRDAIIDTIKSEHRTNAIRKRSGLTRHPIRAVSCGCPDEICGAFHQIRTERLIPTSAEAVASLVADKAVRKAFKRAKQASQARKKHLQANSYALPRLAHERR
jgi:hypothetical protein